jgi:hypothetical protein
MELNYVSGNVPDKTGHLHCWAPPRMQDLQCDLRTHRPTPSIAKETYAQLTVGPGEE